jgi:N12 class adenine-specific DNA methylase
LDEAKAFLALRHTLRQHDLEDTTRTVETLGPLLDRVSQYRREAQGISSALTQDLVRMETRLRDALTNATNNPTDLFDEKAALARLVRTLRTFRGAADRPVDAGRAPEAQELVRLGHRFADEWSGRDVDEITRLVRILETRLSLRSPSRPVSPPDAPEIPAPSPEQPLSPSPAPTMSQVNYTISITADGKYLDVVFPEKPSSAIREGLKQAGFRWHRPIGGWRAKYTPRVQEQVTTLLGRSVPLPETSLPSDLTIEIPPPEVAPAPALQPAPVVESAQPPVAELQPILEEQPRGTLETAPEPRPLGTEPGRTEPAGEPRGGDQDALAGASPEAVPGSEQAGAPEQERDGGGTVRAPETGGAVTPGDAVPGGVGGTAGGGVSSRRGRTRPASPARGPTTTRATGKPGTDYRIPTPEHLEPAGPKDRYRRNVAAIRLLKQLETDERLATPEEQDVLAKYSGWGALAQVFDDANRYEWKQSDWKAEYAELKALLTDDEYRSARASTPNAHFTGFQTIEAIYRALQHMGLEKGRILEPSMGIGNFFGVMPPEMREHSSLTGIELDSLTARMAKHLYQGADIRQGGFEDAKLADNFFDIAVSNVPFGNYSVHDPKYNRYHFPIHTYFFAKALDKVRPGGVVAFITSTYTMDSKDPSQREYLAKRAELLGAIRLPQQTFRRVAGTDVAVDILFLRKPLGTTPDSQAQSWTKVAELPGTSFVVNEYFTRHPDMMLGEMQYASTMYNARNEQALMPRAGEDIDTALDAAILKLPQQVIAPRQSVEMPTQARLIESFSAGDSGLQQDAYKIVNGKVYQRDGEEFVPRNLPAATAIRVVGMVEIRDAARALLALQYQNASDEAVAEAQGTLNTVYDHFVKQHGVITGPGVGNVRAFRADPDFPLLLSLEVYDPETKTVAKAPIFTQRTVRKVERPTRAESPKDALVTSLAFDGRINWAYMTQLTGQSSQQLQAALAGFVFDNPNGGAWETADQYLSGDVRTKLEEAQAAAQTDPRFEAHVTALEAVQPATVPIQQIDMRLGANWIPAETYAQFFAEILESPGALVSYNAPLAEWRVQASASVGNRTTWGVAYMQGHEVAEAVMNFRQPRIWATDADGRRVVDPTATLALRQKMQKMRDDFQTWVLQHPDVATDLEARYNRSMNALVKRSYDGSHLSLPGLSPAFHLRPHQKDAIWRGIQDGSALYAHAVGAGKTLAMTATAMELRRLGLANKPMILVPNHLINQWPTEILRYYPGAKILAATKQDLEPSNRQKFFGRIATGDWDAVVMPYSSFQFIPVSDAYFNTLLQEQIDVLEVFLRDYAEEYGRRDPKVKDLEKAKKKLESQIKKRRVDEAKATRLMSFEELGVDALFVDEIHNYKNLYFTTKMTRVTGLGGGDAKRAFDLFTKFRYIQQVGNGRGVYGATGTPISNTLAEAYTLMRYFMPALMREMGVEHFDAWANAFADTVTRMEVAPTGAGFAPRTSFSRFRNMPELLHMLEQRLDIQTESMLNLPKPDLAGGQPTIVTVPASQPLQAYVQTLLQRAKNLPRDPRIDNMLAITSDGRKAATDIRLVLPDVPEPAQTKTKELVTRVSQIWKDTAAEKGTQLVFLDIGTPQPQKTKEGTPDEEDQDAGKVEEVLSEDETRLRNSVYHDIRQKLMARGIPAQEIAFIHDANTDVKRITLFQHVRAGTIRVLIGSTARMGEGMNVQDRLIALHHFDAPWRPSDIAQREGRILRQGNMWRDKGVPVQIYRYVTEGSFDAYMWQTLERKQRAFGQVMDGTAGQRSMEDLGDARLNNFAEATAAASGNPLVLEKHQLEMQVATYKAARQEARQQRWKQQRELAQLPSVRTSLDAQIAQQEALLQRYKTAEASGQFHMQLGQRAYTNPEDAGKKLLAAATQLAQLPIETPRTVLGTYLGIAIAIRNRGPWRKADGTVQSSPSEISLDIPRANASIEITAANPDPEETINRLNRLVANLPRDIQANRQALANLDHQEVALQQALETPLPYDAELMQVQDRLQAILEATGEMTAATPSAEALLGEDEDDMQ